MTIGKKKKTQPSSGTGNLTTEFIWSRSLDKYNIKKVLLSKNSFMQSFVTYFQLGSKNKSRQLQVWTSDLLLQIAVKGECPSAEGKTLIWLVITVYSLRFLEPASRRPIMLNNMLCMATRLCVHFYSLRHHQWNQYSCSCSNSNIKPKPDAYTEVALRAGWIGYLLERCGGWSRLSAW